MKMIHVPSGITGTFVREIKPTGKPYTTHIMTDTGIYFAPSYEFKEFKPETQQLHE